MGGSKYNHKGVQPLFYSILEYFHHFPEKPGSVPGSLSAIVPSAQASTLLLAQVTQRHQPSSQAEARRKTNKNKTKFSKQESKMCD